MAKILIRQIIEPENTLFACTPTALLQTLFVYVIGSVVICPCVGLQGQAQYVGLQDRVTRSSVG